MYESPYRKTLLAMQPFVDQINRVRRGPIDHHWAKLREEYERLKQLDLEKFYDTLNAFDWFVGMTDDPKTRRKGQERFAQIKEWAGASPAHTELFEAFRAHVFGSDGYGENPAPKPRRPGGNDFRPGDTVKVTRVSWGYPEGTLLKVASFKRGDRGGLWVTPLDGDVRQKTKVEPGKVKLVKRVGS